MDDDAPSQGGVPIDLNYALCPDPTIVGLAPDENMSQEEIYHLRQQLEILTIMQGSALCCLRQRYLVLCKSR